MHLQNVLERFSPYDTLLEIATADDLNDTSLAASFPLHTASTAATYGRLGEITEDSEDGGVPQESSASAGLNPRLAGHERRRDRWLRSGRASSKSTSISPTAFLEDESSAVSSDASESLKKVNVASILVLRDAKKQAGTTFYRPAGTSPSADAGADESGGDVSADSAGAQAVEPPSGEAAAQPTTLKSQWSFVLQQKTSLDGRSVSGTDSHHSVSRSTEEGKLSPEPPDSDAGPGTAPAHQTPNRPMDEDDPYDLKKFDHLFKPKVKLGPRPVTAGATSKRPLVPSVAALPPSLKQAPKKHNPTMALSDRPFSPPAPPPSAPLPAVPKTLPRPPPIPDTPEYLQRPSSRGSIKSTSSRSVLMSPDKVRLMKAVEMRRKKARQSNVPGPPGASAPDLTAPLPAGWDSVRMGSESILQMMSGEELPTSLDLARRSESASASAAPTDAEEDRPTSSDSLTPPSVRGKTATLVGRHRQTEAVRREDGLPTGKKADSGIGMDDRRATQDAERMHSRTGVPHGTRRTDKPPAQAVPGKSENAHRAPKRADVRSDRPSAELPKGSPPSMLRPESPTLDIRDFDHSLIISPALQPRDDREDEISRPGSATPDDELDAFSDDERAPPRRQDQHASSRRRGYPDQPSDGHESDSATDESLEEMLNSTVYKPKRKSRSVKQGHSHGTGPARDVYITPDVPGHGPHHLTGRRDISPAAARRNEAYGPRSSQDEGTRQSENHRSKSTRSLFPRNRTKSSQNANRSDGRARSRHHHPDPGQAWNVQRNGTTNRESMSVTARIVRSPSRSHTTEDEGELQPPNLTLNHERPQQGRVQRLQPIDTGVRSSAYRDDSQSPGYARAQAPPEHEQSPLEPEQPPGKSRTRYDDGSMVFSLDEPGPIPYDDYAAPPPMLGSDRNRDPQFSPHLSVPPSTRATRFFKRMGLHNKRRDSYASQNSHSPMTDTSSTSTVQNPSVAAGSASSAAARPPPSTSLGDITVQFPESSVRLSPLPYFPLTDSPATNPPLRLSSGNAAPSSSTAPATYSSPSPRR